MIHHMIKKLKVAKSKIREKDYSRITRVQVKDYEVEIYIHNRRNPFILEIKNVVINELLLGSLNSADAAIIGYSYGYNLYNYQESGIYSKLSINYFKPISNYLYTISMLDRLGNVFYLNLYNKVQLISSPLEIFLDINQITRFPPTQACYIGIMAGITKLKNYKQTLYHNLNNTRLRLIS